MDVFKTIITVSLILFPVIIKSEQNIQGNDCIIIVSVNQFQNIIVLILSNLNGNWSSDCMFEFILCINWKSVFLVPLKALVLAYLVGQVPVKSRCKQKGVFHVFLENKLTDSYRVVTILMCNYVDED